MLLIKVIGEGTICVYVCVHAWCFEPEEGKWARIRSSIIVVILGERVEEKRRESWVLVFIVGAYHPGNALCKMCKNSLEQQLQLKASFSTHLTCWKLQAVPPSPSLTGEEDGSVEWALQLGCARNGRQWIQIPVIAEKGGSAPPFACAKWVKGSGWDEVWHHCKCYCLAICPRGHLFCLWKKCWHNRFGAGLWNNGLMVHWSVATAKWFEVLIFSIFLLIQFLHSADWLGAISKCSMPCVPPQGASHYSGFLEFNLRANCFTAWHCSICDGFGFSPL